MGSDKLESVNVINEIKDLQMELEQWFRGDTEGSFDKLTIRQAVDMTVINSKGVYETRNEFNDRYQGLFGKYPNIKLSSDILRTKRISKQVISVVYMQNSTNGDKVVERMTTAVFRYNKNTKNHAEWTHVHVTKVEPIH